MDLRCPSERLRLFPAGILLPLAWICALSVAAAHGGEAEANPPIAVWTTEGSWIEGRLTGFRDGFFLVRTAEAVVRISPRFIDTIQSGKPGGEEGANEEVKAYLRAQPSPPAGREEEKAFFERSLREAAELAASLRGTGKPAKAIREAGDLAGGLQNNPRAFLEPKQYRAGLLYLALLREAKRERDLLQALHRHGEAVRESELRAEDRLRVLARFRALVQAWKLPVDLGRHGEGGRRGEPRRGDFRPRRGMMTPAPKNGGS